jgi:hypothetical protein
MKVMCNQCGKVSDLMASTSLAIGEIGEEGQMSTYHFCSEEHMSQFARRKGIALDKR